VNDFHHRTQLDRASSRIIEKPGRQQQQHRANALATSAAQIFANLSDGFHARNGVPPELALNGREIAAQ